jgi:hypothetical protein
MATYSTDFSEYSLGSNLSDWSDFWSTGDFTWEPENNSGTYAVGSKWCYFNASASSRKVVTWDDIGSVSDVDILMLVKGTATGSGGYRVFARVNGTSGNEDGYFFTVTSTAMNLHKYVGGVSTSIQSSNFSAFASTLYWMRFRVNGTDLKGKIWNVDCVEPNDWHIEGTDASLASGAVGFASFLSTIDLRVDFFECVTGGGSATYPPAAFAYNDAFKFTTLPTTGQSYVNYARAMGGQFIDSGRSLHGVGIWCTDHSDDIRVAVYSGGSLSTGLAGADLLYDFGKTSGAVVNDYVQLWCGTPVAVPQSAPLWIVVKGDNAGGFETIWDGDLPHCGNFQIARGRGDVTAIIGDDPDVAFPDPFTAGVTTFANSIYGFKIYLDGHPDSEVVTTTTTTSSTTSTTATTTTVPYLQPSIFIVT